MCMCMDTILHVQYIRVHVYIPSTRGRFPQARFGRVSVLSLHQTLQLGMIFQRAGLHCSVCSAVKEGWKHRGREAREGDGKRENRKGKVN